MEKVREATLVAYFAMKGKEDSSSTARVASLISKTLDEKGIAYDSFAIVPVEEYPSDPANLEIAVKAEKAAHSRPELVGKYSGMKDVKDIFLVVPNWYNSLPQAVYTFFDDYDFSGKRIVPVVLHAGDGEDKVVGEIRSFLHKVWVMPAVGIKDSEVDSCQSSVDKAVEEMLEESKSKY